MSGSVYSCTKEEYILCEAGMDEVHGSHPPTSIHKYPLHLRGREDVVRVLFPKHLLNSLEDLIGAFA